jgi:mannose-1-phosphate guanylyltransferase/phosphomannomutase
MKALVLAAGVGERLRPLTNTTPKPLLEVGGRPLIHRVLKLLSRGGISEVAINVHHLADRIESSLGDGRALGLEITYSPEPVLLGTGAPMVVLRDFFGGEAFVVANSDTILDLDLKSMIKLHRERGAPVTIALYRPSNLDEYSRIEIDEGARIRRMRLLSGGRLIDYPPELARSVELESYMYCGVYICEPSVYDYMPRAAPFSSMGDVFAPMVGRGLPLLGYLHRGLFRTVDDLESLRKLEAEIAANPKLLDST